MRTAPEPGAKLLDILQSGDAAAGLADRGDTRFDGPCSSERQPMTLRLRSGPFVSRLAFRSIVVPVDQSRLAEQAIPTALAIAERARGKVKLVLVHRELPPLLPLEPRQDHVKVRLAMLRSERDYLKSLTHRLRDRMGRALSSAMLHGPVARTLAEYVRDIRADLVVMTSHGHGGLRRAWLGSVADELIRTLEVPVLLVRPGDKETKAPSVDFRRLLVPLDGSHLAEGILEPVVTLARLWDAEISLVQIVPPLALSTDAALAHLMIPIGYSDEVTAVRLEGARTYLRTIAHRVRHQKLSASSTAVLGGSVAETLIELARTGRFGGMAIATHARGGVRRLVLGSVADKLIRAGEVPILVHRPRSRRKRA
ncbi:MAG TPA: universal stress protein [Tepidiformaceae bacterium]|nr:universal stress protein [Tepidiformaceae bacterium]